MESLLLGLPVSGIFLFKESETQTLMVVDGQQRLCSLRDVYQGVIKGREFVLRGVDEGFDGKSYRALVQDDRRGLDDAVIHASGVYFDKKIRAMIGAASI